MPEGEIRRDRRTARVVAVGADVVVVVALVVVAGVVAAGVVGVGVVVVGGVGVLDGLGVEGADGVVAAVVGSAWAARRGPG